MLNITEDIILVGATELRTEMPKLAKALKEDKRAIIMKRGKPMAVLQDFESYEKREKMIDELEDWIAGYIAKERFKNSKPEDYLSHEELCNELGLNDE